MPGCRPVCEGCGAKEAIFGTPLERKRRWCRGCSKAPGAINLSVKMCEGCGAKQAIFGTPLERKRRWCSGCGKLAHGAINLNVKMCEGCDVRSSSQCGWIAAARIRRELAAEAGFAVPSPKDAATRRAADELPAHLMSEPGTAEAAMAAFISSGGEPEPEPK
eukprot:COSAG03_NODE_6679_length_1020_cov_11.213898_1_plen_162_part_00